MGEVRKRERLNQNKQERSYSNCNSPVLGPRHKPNEEHLFLLGHKSNISQHGTDLELHQGRLNSTVVYGISIHQMKLKHNTYWPIPTYRKKTVVRVSLWILVSEGEEQHH